MPSPLNTYTYPGNYQIDESIIKRCKQLPGKIKECRPDIIPDYYKGIMPVQVGFFKENINPIEIPGIDHNTALFNIINQAPGRMLPWHIDKFTEFKNQNNYNSIRTYLMFLSDWQAGQSFGTEHDVYAHWKVGDIIHWEYLVWHYLSNASLENILVLQVLVGE